MKITIQLNIFGNNQIGNQIFYEVDDRRVIPHQLTSLQLNNTKPVIGRENDIEIINNILDQGKKCLVVNSQGGWGKTAVVSEYVRRFAKNYDHIAFVEVPVDFEEDFTFDKYKEKLLHAFASNSQLKQSFAIDYPEKSTDEERFYMIINEMKNLEKKENGTSKRNLLVIDNMPSAAGEIEFAFPPGLNWEVLSASRHYIENFKTHELLQIDSNDLYKIFEFYYNSPLEDYDTLDKILSFIDNHTYTIELLAKSAYTNEWTVKELYLKLKEYGIDFSSKKKFYSGKDGKKKTAYEHLIDIFLTNELSESEKNYLRPFSILPPREIGHETLGNWIGVTKDQIDHFFNILNDLSRKGWLHRIRKENRMFDDTTGLTFKCHPIVQLAVRHYEKPNLNNCFKLVTSINSILKADSRNETFILAKKFAIPFSESLLTNLNFTHENKEIAEIVQIGLMTNLGEALLHLGNYQPGIEYSFKAEQMASLSSYESIRSKLPVIHNNIGLAYLQLGDLVNAKRYLTLAMEANERRKNESKNFGEKEEIFLSSEYNNLAIVHRELGDVATSLDYDKKALEIRKRVLPPNHPLIPQSYNAIGVDYLVLKEYDEAQKFLLEALELRLTHLGGYHPDQGESHHNIARLFYNKGMLKFAFEEYKLAIEIFQENYNESHPWVIKTHFLGAEICLAQKNYALASSILNPIQLIKDSLPTHLRNKLNNLLYSISDSFGEGTDQIKLVKETVRGLKEEIEKNISENPVPIIINLAINYFNLGSLLIDKNEHQQAEQVYSEAIKVCENYLKNNAWHYPIAQKLAMAYQKLGMVQEFNKNEDYFATLLKAFEQFKVLIKTSDKRNLEFFDNLETLGELFQNLGRADIKIQIFQLWLKCHMNAFGKIIEVKCMKHIGFGYQVMADYSNSVLYFEYGWKIYHLHTLDEESLLGELKNGLGVTKCFMLDFHGAIEEFYVAMVIREKLFGENHLETSQIYVNIAEAFYNVDEMILAKQFIDLGVSIRQRELPPNHPHLVRALNWQRAIDLR